MSIFLLVANSMSKDDLISHLYDEINRQNTWYMWTVGILVALITLIIGYFSILQWRISDKQVHKMKEAIDKANNKAEELSEMNKILAKNGLLTLAGSQYLSGLPDWRSDASFYNFIKEKISESDRHLLIYAKSKIADDFAYSIHEMSDASDVYNPEKYLIYKKKWPKSNFEYIIDVKETEIGKLIDSVNDQKLKRKMYSEFQDFLEFWKEN